MRAVKLRRVHLTEGDAPRLQRFFDANPEYSQAINGRPPHATEAHDEIGETPPTGMTFREKVAFGWEDDGGDIQAMAGGLGDFLAAHVWHIGLFIVATATHGSGLAQRLHDELEQWMRDHGARWIRLGVVIGNTRGERFWEKAGYVEVRRRLGVDTGGRVNDLRVMVKPLCDEPIANYLALVARDNPGAP